MKSIGSLSAVVFDETTIGCLMEMLRPAAVVKGGDSDPDAVIRWHGSEVVLVPVFTGWFTTGILEGGIEEGPSCR